MTRSESAAPAARIAVVLIALAVLASWIWTFPPGGHYWAGDFSLYVAHARNIALGRPYAAVNYIPEKVIEKDIPPQGPPTYPPVFPLILAPVYKFAGLNYGAMRALVQALWFISGALFYIYGRRRGFDAISSAAAAGVFLLSSMILSIKDSLLSESTYMVVSACTLLFLDSVYRHNKANRRPLLYGTIAGLLLLTAYLTRVTGIALVGAFAVVELFRVRRIRLFAIAAGAVFLAGFVIYRLTLYDGAGYSNQFRLTPQTWIDNTLSYLKSPASLWGALPAPLRYPAAFLTLLFAAIGWVRTVRRDVSTAEIYVLLFMGPLLVYSSGANTRYIAPLYPLILLYCAEGLRWIGSLPRFSVPGVRRPAMAALAIFLIAGAAANVIAFAGAPRPEGPEAPAFRDAASWVRNNIAPGEVVVSWNPRVVALYTERLSAYYRPTKDPELFGKYLDDLDAKWVLASRQSETDVRWLFPYIESHADRFIPVWRNEDFLVYRVRSHALTPSRENKAGERVVR